jgi:uncharacterized membrane protein YhaH (DUF805 family)
MARRPMGERGVVDLGWYGYFTDAFNLIGQLYTLAVILPSLAVTARRLHDSGRSGSWLLLIAIPIVGWTVLLTLCSIDGDPGPNRYGPSPKRSSDTCEVSLPA